MKNGYVLEPANLQVNKIHELICMVAPTKLNSNSYYLNQSASLYLACIQYYSWKIKSTPVVVLRARKLRN